jgi:hypothetical protein
MTYVQYESAQLPCATRAGTRVEYAIALRRPGYRSRPGAASTSEPQETVVPKDAGENEHDPQRAAKKAKVDELWRKLNSGSNGASSSAAPANAKKPFSLAQLCKPADKSKQNADAVCGALVSDTLMKIVQTAG